VIALVDYGAGNLASVRKALAAVGAEVWTPTVPGELGRAHGIVVPGVGHFDATKQLTEDWRTAIRTLVDDGTPLLGICVGLQWLFEGSDEAASAGGICFFKGTCFHFAERIAGPQPLKPSTPQALKPSGPLKVPHVGWNSLRMPKPSRLMAGVTDQTQVYFTHSYAAPVIDDTVAICEYGVPFSAAVERGNVSAVQFHPEKSGGPGLRILTNWSELVRRSSERTPGAKAHVE
jgi:imidazole glycerol-phosphate synthase subunit HisH